MPRVFFSLALAHWIVLAGVAALGWLDPASEPSRHIALAVFALVLGVFIQVLTFTYFTVTGKVIAQAVHVARLEASRLMTVQRLKSRMTRALASVMLAIVFSVATGAQRWSLRESSNWHVVAAGLALTVHAAAYLYEYALVIRNARLLERVITDYRTAQPSSA